jgi:hypothetical protein
MLHQLKIPNIDLQMENEIINFIQGDLRKLKCIYDIYSNSDILTFTNIQEIFHVKSYNDDTRKITKKLVCVEKLWNNTKSINFIHLLSVSLF